MNPRLIRVVTSQFVPLQGLRTAAFGLMLLLFGLIGTLPRQDEIDGTVRTLLYLVPMTLNVWAVHAIPRFYARRLGRVVRSHAWQKPDVHLAAWIGSGLFLLLVPNGAWDALWIVWATYPLYIVISAWPYRSHYLLVAAAAAYVAANRMQVKSALARPASVAEVSIFAGTIIAVGLLDHLVLMRALPSRAARGTAGSEDPAYDRDAT